jgi:hypothetical protein
MWVLLSERGGWMDGWMACFTFSFSLSASIIVKVLHEMDWNKSWEMWWWLIVKQVEEIIIRVNIYTKLLRQPTELYKL